MEISLLPKHLLIKTSSIDHADWNYKPFLSYIQRKRFKLVNSFISNNHYDKILEIGYGSGIYMPTLFGYCNELCGIDIHPLNEKVNEILLKYGIHVRLYKESASNMSFSDKSFDLIVSVSAFEFIEDKEAACQEIKRVLKKEGYLIIVTPGNSSIIDLGLKILTQESANRDYGEKRKDTIRILKNHFNIKKRRIFPSFIGILLPIYKAYICHVET